MSKSATGTEYVNAQAEDLKDEIDKFAKKISEMSTGATLGMVWLKVFEGSGGAVIAYITGDGRGTYYDSSKGKYVDAYKYTLHAAAGFNGGGGWSKSVDTGIVDAVKPNSTVTASFTPSWYDYSPDVPCSVVLNTSGRVTVNIGSGPSGQANPSASWLKEVGGGE